MGYFLALDSHKMQQFLWESFWTSNRIHLLSFSMIASSETTLLKMGAVLFLLASWIRSQFGCKCKQALIKSVSYAWVKYPISVSYHNNEVFKQDFYISVMKAVGYCFLCLKLKYVQTRLHTVTFKTQTCFNREYYLKSIMCNDIRKRKE